jgi:hypothetical protein
LVHDFHGRFFPWPGWLMENFVCEFLVSCLVHWHVIKPDCWPHLFRIVAGWTITKTIDEIPCWMGVVFPVHCGHRGELGLYQAWYPRCQGKSEMDGWEREVPVG